MSLTRINTNPDALAVQSQLTKIQFDLSRTTSHLSSGLRITSGADDPSGVALADKFMSQLSGTTIALSNVQDGLSLLQLADNALNETNAILLRMRDICVKGSNSAVLTSNDMQNMNFEFAQLYNEVQRRASSVTFNGKTLFNGSLDGVCIQAGPDNSTAYQMSVSIQAVSAAVLGITGLTLSQVTSGGLVRSLIDYVQSSLNIIASIQAGIGAQELKLQHVVNDLSSTQVNLAAAKSRITDADMASEVSDFTREQVLTQAATAMLAQANAQPQTVLSLLGVK